MLQRRIKQTNYIIRYPNHFKQEWHEADDGDNGSNENDFQQASSKW